MGQRAFYSRAPLEWNGLPDYIKNTKEIDIFNRTLFNNIYVYVCMYVRTYVRTYVYM